MTAERKKVVDAMFRSRLSWTVLGAIGLLGLTRDLEVFARGSLLTLAVVGFLWLNRPQVAWLQELRAADDARWQPMAIGLALRCVALAVLLGFSW